MPLYANSFPDVITPDGCIFEHFPRITDPEIHQVRRGDAGVLWWNAVALTDDRAGTIEALTDTPVLIGGLVTVVFNKYLIVDAQQPKRTYWRRIR